MTLMQRVARFTTRGTTGGPYTATSSPTRADLTDQGFVLRHTYPVGDRCPYCAAQLQREEWGQRFTPTVGLNVCRCGYVSQQFTIA